MQIRQVVGIANRDDSLGGAVEFQPLRMQPVFLDHFQIELLRFLAVRVLGLSIDLLRNLKDHKKSKRKCDAPNRRNLLGEQIHNRGDQQDDERKRQAQGKIHAARRTV